MRAYESIFCPRYSREDVPSRGGRILFAPSVETARTPRTEKPLWQRLLEVLRLNKASGTGAR